MNFKIWHVYLIILVVACAAGDGVYAYYQSHQSIEIAPENRRTFVHAVAAVDATRSMPYEAVAAAKQIVATRIIPSIGPGDRLLCLAIGPRYGLSSSVFGATFEDQEPQLPENRRAAALETITRLRHKPDDTLAVEEVRNLAREMFPLWPGVERVSRSWSERVQKLQRPKRDGTSIRALLEGVQAEFDTPPRPHEEHWLFILSDLLDEPPAGVHALSQAANKSALGEMHVVLLYPHNSDKDWDGIKRYWRDQYFRGCEITFVPFSKALDDAFLLAPGPMAGLQAVDLRTAWDYLLPLLLPEALLICVAAALGHLFNAQRRPQEIPC